MNDLLKRLNCKAIYLAGSRLIPFIKNPRDFDYMAIFETIADKNSAPKEKGIHCFVEDQEIEVPSWGYLFHYLNKSKEFIGTRCSFREPTLEELKLAAKKYKKDYIRCGFKKSMYRIAMLEAIAEYGYDNLPQKVMDGINDLHDMKITYKEYIRFIRKK